MKIQTTRFGELNVPKECLIRFETGLAGFPRYKKFALFPYEENSPFHILQSVGNKDLTFLLADPYRFFDGYVFELDDALTKDMGFSTDNYPAVYCLVTLKDKIDDATINLLGPLLVNWRDHAGIQVTLQDTSYSVRQMLFPEGLPLAKKRAKVQSIGRERQIAAEMLQEAIG